MARNSESESNRKISLSSRFEVEKVGETDLNNSLKATTTTDAPNEKADENKSAAVAIVQSTQPPSNLKKTVKHYIYDDDFFDLDSGQNTAKDKKSYLQSQSSYEMTKNQSNSRADVNDLSSDEDEVKKPPEADNSSVGCFQINYDERNDPIAITCNLNSNGVNSYKNCVHDFKTIYFYQKLIAEFTGTMLLTLYACSIGLPIAEKKGDAERISLAEKMMNSCLGGGLTLATLIWVMGNVSGGHFNPAVTIAFLFTGKINPLMAFMYIGSQLVGAIIGSFILLSISPQYARGNLSVTSVHPDLHVGQALGVEIIITFILVFTIFSCVDNRRKDLHGSFPLQIGLAVTVGALFGGRFTGGSMNPARSFGPAVAMGSWKDHWLYWIGPILGSLTAAFIYQFGLTLKCPRKPYRRVPNQA